MWSFSWLALNWWEYRRKSQVKLYRKLFIFYSNQIIRVPYLTLDEVFVKPPRFSRNISFSTCQNPIRVLKIFSPAFSERLRHGQFVCYISSSTVHIGDKLKQITTITIWSGCFTVLNNIKPLINQISIVNYVINRSSLRVFTNAHVSDGYLLEINTNRSYYNAGLYINLWM